MFRLSDAAPAAAALHLGPDARVSRVVTDSRAIQPGDLFVALTGERFDGQAFADQALAAGASGVMVSDPTKVHRADASILVVPDTRAGLGRLAVWWRNRQVLRLAAITGSNGKTTIKEMLASILRAHAGEAAVLATEGNLNNDIGVPLTLLRLSAEHRYAVIEMGMNHLGEIDHLTRLARPDVAAIGNAGMAHIGELGSRENIARAKGEIFAGLGADGIAVINADDAFAGYWRGLVEPGRRIEFSLDTTSTSVRGRCEAGDDGSLLTFITPAGSGVARLRVPGIHNVRNALCAVAVAHALGAGANAIAAGLTRYRGVSGRLERRSGPAGARLIDDAYNANPDSMKAAVAWLSGIAGRRLFVMGDMGELGPDARALHAEVGAFARAHGIDLLFALGADSTAAVEAFGPGASHFTDVEALAGAVAAQCDASTSVLVKGSRFMRMERVVERLATDKAQAGSAH